MAEFLNQSQELAYPREFVVEFQDGTVSIRRIPRIRRGMLIDLAGLGAKESVRQLRLLAEQVTDYGFHRLVFSLPNASCLAGAVGEFLDRVAGHVEATGGCIVVALPMDTLSDAHAAVGPSNVLRVQAGIEKAVARVERCEHRGVETGQFQDRLHSFLITESDEASSIVVTNIETLMVLLLGVYYRNIDPDPMPQGARTVGRLLEYVDPARWSFDEVGDIFVTYGQHIDRQLGGSHKLPNWLRTERLVDEFSAELELDRIFSTFVANRKGPNLRRDWYEDIDLLGRLAFGTTHLPPSWPEYQFD